MHLMYSDSDAVYKVFMNNKDVLKFIYLMYVLLQI